MLKVIRSKHHNLFLPLLFWIAGISIASYYKFSPYLYLLPALTFIIYKYIKASRSYIILLSFTFLAWAYTSSMIQVPPNHISNFFLENSPIKEIFEFKVIDVKKTLKGKNYYLIKLKKLNTYNIKGKLLLYNSVDSLRANYLYKAPLQVTPILPADNPGQFDFSKYYSYQGISGQALALGLSKEITKEENIFQHAKSYIVSKIEDSFGQNKSIALALFLGKKGLLDFDKDELAEMGILHLFAVSGLHVGIIYLTLLTIMNLLVNLNKARMLSSIILVFYGYLCSWSPSVLRTVLLIMIYNSVLVFQRKISFLQIISLTLFIISIFNPLEIFSVALHLSFVAFISLWIADRKLMPICYKFIKKLPFKKYLSRILQYLVFSLSVILFLAPLSAYYFNIISLNSIITNVLATPLVTLMLNIVFLSLFLPINSLIMSFIGNAFDLLCRIFYGLIDFGRTLPFFSRDISLTGSELIILLFSLSICIYIYQRSKKIAFTFASLLIVLLILRVNGFLTPYHNQVICFNAGKADCSYLEFSDRKNLLIDTGSQEQNPIIVENAVLPYLKKRHISKLDLVIITHPHEDHYGGLSILVDKIKIDQIIIHKTALKDDKFLAIINDLPDEVNIKVIADSLSLWNNRISFLHPLKAYESSNMNNNSLVTMIKYADNRLLFTGDIEEDAESVLVEKYGVLLKADFLKIAHHGSITSTTSDFLKRVNAKKCFIPAGKDKQGKFPNPLVLKRLKEMDIEVHNGGIDGALLMKY